MTEAVGGRRLLRIAGAAAHSLALYCCERTGLFKDFVTNLCKIAFDPSYGLFNETKDHCLYPNPDSGAVPSTSTIIHFYTHSHSHPASRLIALLRVLICVYGADFADDLAYFQFMGQVVGKCLYEGITLETVFAGFFLKKLIGRSGGVDDLASLDAEYYTNLIKLKARAAFCSVSLLRCGLVVGCVG